MGIIKDMINKITGTQNKNHQSTQANRRVNYQQTQRNANNQHLKGNMDLIMVDNKYYVYEYKNIKGKEDYDTTRLYINKSERLPNGRTVFSVLVSWYDSQEPEYIAPELEALTDKNRYTEITLGLDVDRLQSDEAYQDVLMRSLLDKERVLNKYLKPSLENQKATGNYIGEVTWNPSKGKYEKSFDPRTGELVHNLPKQRQQREEWAFEKKIEKKNQMERYIKNYERNKAEMDRIARDNRELEKRINNFRESLKVEDNSHVSRQGMSRNNDYEYRQNVNSNRDYYDDGR